MKTYMKYALVAAAMLSIPTANATLMQVEATGTIYSGYDYSNALGSGVGNLNGQTITSTWTFDTDNLPNDYYGGSYTNTAYYHDNSDWITSTITVSGGGNTFDEDTQVDDATNEADYLYLQDNQYGYDHYQIYSYSYDNSPYEYFYNYAYIYEYIDDIVQGLGADQTFDWTNNDSSDYGYGYFSLYEPSTFALFCLGLAGLYRVRKNNV